MNAGYTKVNIVVMKIVQLADASASLSAAVDDDTSLYPSLNALVGYTSPRKYQDINLCHFCVLELKQVKESNCVLGKTEVEQTLQTILAVGYSR